MTALLSMLASAGQWLLKHPLWIAVIGLTVLLGLAKWDAHSWHSKADQSHQAFLLEKAAFTATVANFRAATAQAQAADQAHARDVEHRDAGISQEAQNDLTKQRDDAVARAADYARRLRAGTAESPVGGGSATGLPVPAGAAGAADGAGATAVVPAADLTVCAENSVKAQGWPDWWRKVSAAPR